MRFTPFQAATAVLSLGVCLAASSTLQSSAIDQTTAQKLNAKPTVQAELQEQAKPSKVFVETKDQKQKVQIDTKFAYQPKIIEGRAALAIKDITDTLGLKLNWDSKNKIASIDAPSSADPKVSIPMNRKAIALNDQIEKMDTIAAIDSTTGRTYLPIRSALAPLGYEIKFDAPTNEITIKTSAYLLPDNLRTASTPTNPTKPAPTKPATTNSNTRPSNKPLYDPEGNYNPEYVPQKAPGTPSKYNTGVPLISTVPAKTIHSTNTNGLGDTEPSTLVGVPLEDLKPNEKRTMTLQEIYEIFPHKHIKKMLPSNPVYTIIPENTILDIKGNKFIPKFTKRFGLGYLLDSGAKGVLGSEPVEGPIGSVLLKQGYRQYFKEGGILPFSKTYTTKDIQATIIKDRTLNICYLVFHE